MTPTAATATVSGRIVNARGFSIRGVTLALFNATTGETRYAVSNNFGFYSFTGLEVGHFYVLTAYSSARHTIVNNQRSFTLSDDLSNADFVVGLVGWLE